MNQNKRRISNNYISISFNPFTIWSDVKKFLWVIISISLSMAFLAYIVKDISYKPVYRIEATYYVTSRGINNDILTNMSTAQNMASRYSQIFTSSTIKTKAAETVGIEEEDFIISSEVVTDTNIVILRVTADTPDYAFRLMECVRDTYPELSQYLVTDAIINELTPLRVNSKPTFEVNLKITMLKALVLAVGILLILVIAFSCLRDTIRSGSDIEKKLNARDLGEIPFEKIKKNKKHNKNYGALQINKQTVSFRYVESIGKISRKLVNHMRRKQAKTLLVTSYYEHEGKTTVVANLALSLADQGKKVLLIDFDLKRPSLYKFFNVSETDIVKIGDLLKGDVPKLSRLAIPKTKIYGIFNTLCYQNSTELLSSKRIIDIIENLKENFDYILFDTPPVSACADVETAAAFVDVYLVVIKEHLALAKQVNDTLDILFSCPGYVVGCVLNAAYNTAGQGHMSHGYGRRYNSNYEYIYNQDRYN